jgi:hypothetical protein
MRRARAEAGGGGRARRAARSRQEEERAARIREAQERVQQDLVRGLWPVGPRGVELLGTPRDAEHDALLRPYWRRPETAWGTYGVPFAPLPLPAEVRRRCPCRFQQILLERDAVKPCCCRSAMASRASQCRFQEPSEPPRGESAQEQEQQEEQQREQPLEHAASPRRRQGRGLRSAAATQTGDQAWPASRHGSPAVPPRRERPAGGSHTVATLRVSPGGQVDIIVDDEAAFVHASPRRARGRVASGAEDPRESQWLDESASEDSSAKPPPPPASDPPMTEVDVDLLEAHVLRRHRQLFRTPWALE